MAWSTARALAVVVAVLGGPLIGLVSPANAVVQIGASPTFPSSAPVGGTGLPAVLEIRNASTSPDASGAVQIQPVPGGGPNAITLVPSCGNTFPTATGSCGSPDPGVVSVSPTAFGEFGTACAGVNFSVTVIDATGKVAFAPSSPVVLQPPGSSNDTCRIDFTFNVLKSPTTDAHPGLPGVQTAQIGYASGANTTTGSSGASSSVSVLTVPAATPTMTTVATGVTQIGNPISDMATITGVTGGPSPTGAVTFSLFGPGDPTCIGGSIFPSGPQVLTPGPPGSPPTATTTSGTFVPTSPGSYNWVAAYSGDANYQSTTSPCGATSETSVVTQALATMTTQALTPVTLGAPIRDTATVVGAPAPAPTPTGTVSFSLYGPANPTCTGAPAFTSLNRPLAGTPRTATSADFPPTAAGSYNWVAVYSGDSNYPSVVSPCGSPSETSMVNPGASSSGRFTPLTPARILDTRDGTGGLAGPVGPGATVDVQVTGQGGVPASGVTAVAVNVTVTQPSAGGYLALYPTGTTQPLASNLNFAAGKTVPNLVVVKPGTGGKVALFNATGTTHVIFDVAGWYSDVPAGNAGRYTALTPNRILDTRNGTGGGARLSPGASLDLQVSSAGGVPASGAQAAVLNVAATGTTATGYLTVYPTGDPRPPTSNLNFEAGQTVSNRAMVKLGTGGKVTIFNASGSTDVIVDAGGWFTDASLVGSVGVTTALTPARTLDTRDGTGGIGGPLGAGSIVDVQVTGQGGVPASGVSAVILNATVVSPSGPGWLTIFPTGQSSPASDLNYAAGENRANLVVVKVGTGGKVSLFTSAGAHVIFDVAGWTS